MMKFTKETLEKAKAATSAAELLVLAKANGTKMTENQANALFADLHKTGELADEELDNVSGGGWGSADCDYESGDNPKGHLGQRVQYKINWVGITSWYYGKISKVYPKKDGGQFVYDIKDDDGDDEYYVLESQINWFNSES